eukprot:TRINITY_DN10353_c0_g1_i2.p1 TRINITY_DN10353_c0_g1~~TRINITY_DN10353_c0_g1_i2.p1  ORF type:complete len:305 (+),score=97.55 TRINITY_DN10353_c0_g1_i2:59-916(+)
MPMSVRIGMRWARQRRGLSAGAIDGVPGLFLCRSVVLDADGVRAAAERVWEKVTDAAWADKHGGLPQRVHRSQNHNLPLEREYQNVRIREKAADDEYFEPDIEDGFSMTGREGDMAKPKQPVHCAAQYFAEYGGPGHGLAYFMTTDNIPSSIRATLLPAVAYACGELLGPEYRDVDRFNWRLTLNAYKDFSTEFPYHKDIASNGDVTCIYSIGMPSRFELCPEATGIADPAAASLELVDNSLAILSGEARWEWVHRVKPIQPAGVPRMVFGDVNRMSLVLGCTPL